MPREPWDGWRSVALRLAVLGALTAISLGLAADGPRQASSTPWRLGRPDPGAVGALALAALGLGALLLVLGLLGRREGQAAPRRRSSPWTGVVLVAAALLLGLLVDRRSDRGSEQAPAEEPVATVPPGASDLPAPDGTSTVLVAVLVLTCVLAAVLAARRRPGPLPPPTAVEDGALGEGLAAAAGSLRASTGSAPRDRIIAAYAAFEDALAARGLARSPSTTPAGLLAASLAEGSPAGPAARLTELFTTARFADRRMTAADVDAAERALDELLAAR